MGEKNWWNLCVSAFCWWDLCILNISSRSYLSLQFWFITCRKKLFHRRRFLEDQMMKDLIHMLMEIVVEGISNVVNQHLLNHMAHKKKTKRSSCSIWRNSRYNLYRSVPSWNWYTSWLQDSYKGYARIRFCRWFNVSLFIFLVYEKLLFWIQFSLWWTFHIMTWFSRSRDSSF